MTDTSTFWMICRRPTHPRSKTEPKARFASREAARAEAQQLADQTGADFLLIAPVETVRPATATPDLFQPKDRTR